MHHDLNKREGYFRLLLTLVSWEMYSLQEISIYFQQLPLFQESSVCLSVFFDTIKEIPHLRTLVPDNWKSNYQKQQVAHLYLLISIGMMINISNQAFFLLT